MTAAVLAKMFRLVETGEIQAPLFDPATQDPSMTNSKFVAEYCANLLKGAFPHLTKCVPIPFTISTSTDSRGRSAQVSSFVQALREQSGDPVRFKIVVRDFLVVMREFQSEDTAELFADEREAEREKKLAEERERAANVPGMLKVRSFPSCLTTPR